MPLKDLTAKEYLLEFLYAHPVFPSGASYEKGKWPLLFISQAIFTAALSLPHRFAYA